MIGTLLVTLLVIAAGARMTDALKVRQQEVVLKNLPVAEAHAYYELLRKRARQTRLLRAIALVSILALGYAYRRTLAGRPPSSLSEPPP